MCQPGFEFEHFELLSKEWLNKHYPELTEINERYALKADEIEKIITKRKSLGHQ